jgi:hypothetical protein
VGWDFPELSVASLAIYILMKGSEWHSPLQATTTTPLPCGYMKILRAVIMSLQL